MLSFLNMSQPFLIGAHDLAKLAIFLQFSTLNSQLYQFELKLAMREYTKKE